MAPDQVSLRQALHVMRKPPTLPPWRVSPIPSHTRPHICPPSSAPHLPPPDPLPRRYGALKSLGEKKSCFNEYIIQRKNEEKEEERRKLKQAREDLLALVIESPELKLTHSYRRAKEIFEDDPRWKVRPAPPNQ